MQTKLQPIARKNPDDHDAIDEDEESAFNEAHTSGPFESFFDDLEQHHPWAHYSEKASFRDLDSTRNAIKPMQGSIAKTLALTCANFLIGRR